MGCQQSASNLDRSFNKYLQGDVTAARHPLGNSWLETEAC